VLELLSRGRLRQALEVKEDPQVEQQVQPLVAWRACHLQMRLPQAAAPEESQPEGWVCLAGAESLRARLLGAQVPAVWSAPAPVLHLDLLRQRPVRLQAQSQMQ